MTPEEYHDCQTRLDESRKIRERLEGRIEALEAVNDKATSRPDGLRAARRYACWYLGDSDWADSIIDAYLNPSSAIAQLGEEGEGS